MITHGNFTEGGVSPCARIEGQLGSWEQAVGDYHEWVGRHDAGEATAKEGTGRRRRRSQPRQRRSFRIRVRRRHGGEVATGRRRAQGGQQHPADRAGPTRSQAPVTSTGFRSLGLETQCPLNA